MISFDIILQRASAPDDKIQIVKLENDRFELFYRYMMKDTVSATIMTEFEVIKWFRSFLWLLTCDVEPYTHVQLDYPLMPTILLSHHTFEFNTIQMHVEILKQHLHLWPKELTSVISTYQGAGVRETGEEEEEEKEKEEKKEEEEAKETQTEQVGEERKEREGMEREERKEINGSGRSYNIGQWSEELHGNNLFRYYG